MKRYLVEFGSGVDIHGGDCTKAAVRAAKDAVSHRCMCGIEEILQIRKPAANMRLKLKIAAPYPEHVDIMTVKGSMPYNGANTDIEVVEGGMSVTGIHVDALGDGDQIVIVNAAITVLVNVNE